MNQVLSVNYLRQAFPYSVLWIVILTILLAVCIALAATYFDCIYFLVVLVGLLVSYCTIVKILR